eukprot:849830-Heterocapsa_arctica.AAC.1
MDSTLVGRLRVVLQVALGNEDGPLESGLDLFSVDLHGSLEVGRKVGRDGVLEHDHEALGQ